MASIYQSLTDEDRHFISQQPLFFVATAASEGSINLSPKGRDTLRVMSDDRVVWMNLTGSGNETAAHLRDDGRITLMFCSFGERPLILRLYAEGRVIHPRDAEWQALVAEFGEYPSARQLIDCKISSVQRSCGFGVPLMEYQGVRPNIEAWVARQGDEGIRRYWAEKNQYSIDGLPTHILEDS